MIQKIKRVLMSLSIIGLLGAPMLAPAVVYAAPDCDGIQDCLDKGSCETDTANCASTSDPTERVNGLIRLIINIFSLVVGVIAVIMIIIGGLKYILSGGDSGNVTGAKNTILFAIVGLIIVALAQIIVRFVLKKVTE